MKYVERPPDPRGLDLMVERPDPWAVDWIEAFGDGRLAPSEPFAIGLSALAVSTLARLAESEAWIPRGQLFDAAIRIAYSLTRPAAAGEWNSVIREDRRLVEMVEAVRASRMAERETLLDDLSNRFSDRDDPRQEILNAIEQLTAEQIDSFERLASDALFYWLAFAGTTWAAENERPPDPSQDLDSLIGRGLAADLRICEPVRPLLLDMLWTVEKACGGAGVDQDVPGGFEAVFFDHGETESLLAHCQIAKDARLTPTAEPQSLGKTIRALMIERWQVRGSQGVTPWGETTPCLIPDPLQPGSVKQLLPA